MEADDTAPTPDGGLLIGADFALQYVPPATPTLLGVALLPAARRVAPDLTVSLTTTIPAGVRIGLWRHGKRVARVGAFAPGGPTTIAVGERLPAGQYELRVRAAAGAQLAGAHAAVLIGGLLPMTFARDWVRSRLDLFETYEEQAPYHIRCRRLGRRRIDCAMLQQHRCTGIASIRLALDGTLSAVTYDGGRTCRIRRSPDLGDARRRRPGLRMSKLR